MVTIGGVVSSLNRRFTKRGDQMATFVLEDMDASIEVTVFAKVLAEFGHLLANDLVVTVTGRLNKREDNPASFSAQRIVVPQNLDQRIPEIVLSLPAGFTAEKLDTLKTIISEFPGMSPPGNRIYMDNRGNSRANTCCKARLLGRAVFIR